MATTLINGLGGPAGFGEQFLARNDDGSTGLIDLSSIFPDGLNFFGASWGGLYINNNGNVTFGNPLSTFTPFAITGQTARPIIAPFFADVDTRGTPGGVTPGGASQGNNLLYYDLDPATGTLTVTWDDVGYYSNQVNKLNAFQLQLVRVGETDFDIVFRYEDINWTTGGASGGSNGLGGTVARAGYSSGDGRNYFELPQSGSQGAVLDLENTSNVGQAGLWVFQVRNGTPVVEVSISDVRQVEGNGPGSTEFVFDVFLSAPATEAVTVNYVTRNGSADGSDFLHQAGTVVFAPGQVRQTVRIEVVGDQVAEQDETFFVDLSGVLNAQIADATGRGTILNDDGLVINDVQVLEGSGPGTTQATFTVTLLAASTQTVTVDFATQPGTAAAPADFTAVQGTLTFAPGEVTRTVTVAIARDTVAEADEQFQVVLSNAVNAQIADGVGQGVITNDDGLIISDATALEGSGGGTTPFTFTVSLLSAATEVVTVGYRTVAVSATADADFVPQTGMLTFQPGELQKTVTVLVNRDSAVEPDELFELRLENPQGTAITDGVGIGTIRNDDGLSVSDVFVVEGTGGVRQATFVVSLSSASNAPVSVSYATQPGTADASDFTAQTGTLTFAAGETTKSVTVDIATDALPEADEQFSLVLSNASGSGIVDGTGVAVIRNDDGFLVSNATSVSEGNSGSRTVDFTVSLSGPASGPTSVRFSTADGTASAGSDYVATSGVLNFAAGQTSQTVQVQVLGDTEFEPNETFRLVLSDAQGTAIVDGSGTATILNDDSQPAPVLSISGARMTEGTGAGETQFRFVVSLSHAASSTVSVSYETQAGSATLGGDFLARSGTLTFAAGQLSQEVVVPVVRDGLVEPDETFSVVLSNLVGSATLGNGTGVGTILNDDITFSAGNDIQVTEGVNASAVFTVTLNGASALPVSVRYDTRPGSATSPSDYQTAGGVLVFNPGETSRTVTVGIVNDGLHEVAEFFDLVLSQPSAGVITDATARATIINDDPPPPPVITQLSEDTGASASDGVTRDNTQTLTITSQAGLLIRVFDNGLLLGQASEVGSGVFQLTTPVLPDGRHVFTATASGADNLQSAASAPKVVVVDTAAPARPVIVSATNDTGVSSSDGITSDTTQTLQITAEAGATVRVFDGATLLGVATETSAGVFSYTTAALAAGSHSFTATATDLAGNSGAASAVRALTIDTQAPRLQSASVTPQGSSMVLTWSEALAASQLPGAGSFTIRADGELIGVSGMTVSGATLTLQLARLVGQGQNVTLAYADPSSADDAAAIQDVAGNDAASLSMSVSNQSTGGDVTAPAAPRITSLSDDTGVSASDGLTRDATLTLGMTAEAGSTVRVYNGGALLGVATETGAGVFRFTTAALADGTYSLLAKATDAAGNVSAGSEPKAVRVDTTAIALSQAGVTGNGTSLVLSYSEPLVATALPPASAFRVWASGQPVEVTALSAAGNVLTLTLAQPVQQGQRVTVSYNDPTAQDDAQAIQDAAGNDAVSLNAWQAGNASTQNDPALPHVTAVLDPEASSGLNALYRGDTGMLVTVPGLVVGDVVLDALRLMDAKGAKAFKTPSGVNVVALDDGGSDYAIAMVKTSGASKVFSEQRFTAEGLAQGKVLTLSLPVLLQRELRYDQDLNQDGILGNGVKTQLIASDDTNSVGLYDLVSGFRGIDESGLASGDRVTSQVIELTSGSKAWAAPKGASLLGLTRLDDGGFGVVFVVGSGAKAKYSEQKFNDQGQVNGKAVVLGLPLLLQREDDYARDFNRDGMTGDGVSAVLDAHDSALAHGLYRLASGGLGIARPDAGVGDELDEALVLQAGSKLFSPGKLAVIGLAQQSDDDFEVLLKGGTASKPAYSLAVFDDEGLQEGKALKLTAQEVSAREYFYDQDLDGDGQISMTGLTTPPADFV